MMKIKFLTLFFICLMLCSRAQNKSVNFISGSFEEAIERAKVEDKDVLLYLTAVWCTPCREMEKTTFQDSAVMAFVDENFIAIKVDIDSLAGKSLEKEFKTIPVPHYHIVNPDDRSLNYSFAGSMSSLDFLKELKESLNPENSALAISQKKYQDGNRDYDFLLDHLVLIDRHGGDKYTVYNDLVKYANSEQRHQTEMFSLMERYLHDKNGLDYKFVKMNEESLKNAFGADRVNSLLNRPVFMELDSIFFVGDSLRFYQILNKAENEAIGNIDRQLFEIEANFLLRYQFGEKFMALVESSRYPKAFSGRQQRLLTAANLTSLNIEKADMKVVKKAQSWINDIEDTDVQLLILAGNFNEKLQELTLALDKYEEALALYKAQNPEALVEPGGILSLIDGVKKKITAL